ncbi:MAG: PASTA domain-containing protein, partial [Bdellovibrionales bacterium]|nr:PASTA domain-containing protein [Bdellovibrionales bacterium]
MKRAFLTLLLLSIFPNFGYAAPSKKTLVQTSSTGPSIGGEAPTLLKLDVVKEFKKAGRVFYGVKAIVKRASGDRNGKRIIWKPKRYRDAIAQLVDADPGIVSTLDFLFPKSIDNRKFPPVALKYTYTLLFDNKGINKVTSKKPLGPQKFVEPVKFGFEPGTHSVTLNVCVDIDDHPILDAYGSYELIATLADIPGWIASNLTPVGIATNIATTVVKNKISCSTNTYQFKVLAKVPNVVGLSESKARKELVERGLNTYVVQKTCNDDLEKISKQKPAASQRVEAGTTVNLVQCSRPSKEQPENFAGLWKTNFGNISFVQDDKGNVAATYLWSGGGSLTAKVVG